MVSFLDRLEKIGQPFSICRRGAIFHLVLAIFHFGNATTLSVSLPEDLAVV